MMTNNINNDAKARYKIVCICQIYNELRKENLERFVKYVKPFADELVVYDDGSTDGSYEYMLQHTPYVLRGLKNDFASERNHKQQLLDVALKLNPDFIFYLDADEVFSANAETRLQELCEYCDKNMIDGINFQKINLWRSNSWRRIDSLFNEGWFVQLWRVTSDMSYGNIKRGLHQPPYPPTVRTIEKVNDVKVLHYGFASKLQLAYKYLIYKSHGQRGYNMLDRLINEEKLEVEKVPAEMFPEGLFIDDPKPQPLSFEESLAYVENLRQEVFKPNFSIVCLTYKSAEWAKFVYEQVFKYTDMADKEFFFVANDANDAVLNYLSDNYVSHFVWQNAPEQQSEWYINNVYRAWNFAAGKARGDFIVFINTDMAFTPNWFENLWKAYNGSNCIAARLVESGKLRSGQYGIEKDFGRNFDNFEEARFNDYAASISTSKLENGGLFMPLLIRKQHFASVNGYPEGNIVPGTDIFTPRIAKQGGPCISGDVVLMEKLKTTGISHQTAFDSVVYHFQCGEMDGPESRKAKLRPKIAICNDLVTGTMGEKVLWDFMLEFLPATVGIDKRVVGEAGDYAANARDYISNEYPEVDIILQNATFIGTVDPSRYTIAFLQDNLRAMERGSGQQEENLRLARKLVTNSTQTALSYPEYDFEIIPIGVDANIFKPLDKRAVRKEFGFGNEQIGIFVGNLSEVKGWSKVYECIKKYSEINWIIVTKNNETLEEPNVRVFSRIDQPTLAKLLNCADFFILGSPVETQCLAAVEAGLCDLPIIMRNTGIFAQWSEDERLSAGLFDEDIFNSINKLSEYEFKPRQTMIAKRLTIDDSNQKWKSLIVAVSQEIAAEKINSKKHDELISVVIPTFNQAKYLPEALDSLIAQTYNNWEAIVVNDGSTDNTSSVIETYIKNDSRIKAIHQKNQGIAKALNRGISEASGEFFCWLSSDDLYLPKKLEMQIDFFRNNTSLSSAIVVTGCNHIDAEGNIIRQITTNPMAKVNGLANLVLRGNYINGCTVMIPMKIIKELGGFDPTYKYAQDYDMWTKIALQNPVIWIDEPLVAYRVHEEQGSTANELQCLEESYLIMSRIFQSNSLAQIMKDFSFNNEQEVVPALRYILDSIFINDAWLNAEPINLQFWEWFSGNMKLFFSDTVILDILRSFGNYLQNFSNKPSVAANLNSLSVIIRKFDEIPTFAAQPN